MTANVEPWPPNGGIGRLNETRFDDVQWISATGSSNADLLELASTGHRTSRVLFTDHQTAGRGRQNRSWHDEPGDSLLVSVLTPANVEWASLVPLATGVAAVSAVDRFLGVDDRDSPVGLKWPNDVLAVGGREPKLAGILVEARTAMVAGSTEAEMMIVIGMGLNLRWSTPPPPEVQERGITLELLDQVRRHPLTGLASDGVNADGLRASARNELLIHYLLSLDQALQTLSGPDGVVATLARYRSRCLTIGRQVSFATAAGTVSGTAGAIGKQGELLVTDINGREHELVAGDAHHQPDQTGAGGR